MTGAALIVFDMDGTLVDSQAHILAAMEHAHAGTGVSCPARGEVLEIVGLSLPEAFAHLHPELDDAARAALVEGYKQAFGALRHDTLSPLFPGVVEGLDRLAALPGLRLGVATGKSRRGLDAICRTHGLAKYFATMQCADDHPSKPHPSMLWAALRETGARADRATMIGDTEFDIAMGRAAGMRTIGVAWGYHAPARLVSAGADALVDDWAALEAHLCKWSQAA